MWPVNKPHWNETKTFDFKCYVIDSFAYKQIRVLYRLPFPFEDDKIQSSFENTKNDDEKRNLTED